MSVAEPQKNVPLAVVAAAHAELTRQFKARAEEIKASQAAIQAAEQAIQDAQQKKS